MSRITKSLAWAGAIIAATLVSVANGLSDGATFGIIAGLSGAAIGSIYGRGNACTAGR